MIVNTKIKITWSLIMLKRYNRQMSQIIVMWNESTLCCRANLLDHPLNPEWPECLISDNVVTDPICFHILWLVLSILQNCRLLVLFLFYAQIEPEPLNFHYCCWNKLANVFSFLRWLLIQFCIVFSSGLVFTKTGGLLIQVWRLENFVVMLQYS